MARSWQGRLADIERGWNKMAAFQLHQAAEHYCKCAILVVTAYWPKEHNIKYLAPLGNSWVGVEPSEGRCGGSCAGEP
jgi:HEPN domain-containing protein